MNSQEMKYITNPDNWAMSAKVIEWMTTNLSPNCRVVELGGGNGSFRLHHHFKDVVTVEHDTQWAKVLFKQGLPVLLCPLHGTYYRDDERLLRLIKAADVIVIDGPQGDKRLGFVRYFEHVKDQCILVIDDTQRAYMKRLMRYETLHVINDNGRTTHIQRADNKDNPKATPMVEQTPKPRTNKTIVSHPQMEKVSEEISGNKSTVRKVRKKRKRL